MKETRWHSDYDLWTATRPWHEQLMAIADHCGCPISTEQERIASFYKLVLIRDRLPHRLPGFELCELDNTNLLYEYLWHATGRKRWFIDHSTLSVLRELSLEDENLSGVHFPYDSFHLIFEHGSTTPKGLPLRWIRIGRCASSLATRLLEYIKAPVIDTLAICVDNGQRCIAPFTYDHDTPHKDSAVSLWTRDIDHNNFKDTTASHDAITFTGEDFDARDDALHIAIAVVLLYAARPELIVPYTVPRSSRYTFKPTLPEGGKALRLVSMMPTWKIVRIGDSGPATGKTVAPHFRAGCLRTYRHDKFKRKPDGSLVVKWIDPCAVHSELLFDVNTLKAGAQNAAGRSTMGVATPPSA